MKTIGTLEEIGAQVGDVVEYHGRGVPGGHRTVASDKPNSNGWWMATDGKEMWQDSPYFRIVTRAAKSPVRTVTRKEIVPGIYGKVSVHQLRPDNGGYYIAMVDSLTHKESTVHSPMTEADLTAAIKTLTEIRDAMQDNA